MERRLLSTLLIFSIFTTSCRSPLHERSRLKDDNSTDSEHEIKSAEYDPAPTSVSESPKGGGVVEGAESIRDSQPSTQLDFGEISIGPSHDGPEITGETFEHRETISPTDRRELGPRGVSSKGEGTLERRRAYSPENETVITAQIEKEKLYLNSMKDGLSRYDNTLSEMEHKYNTQVSSLLSGMGAVPAPPVTDQPKEFKTSPHTVPGKRLENAWAYRNQVKSVVEQDTSSQRAPRQQLLDFADVNLDLADRAYSDKTPAVNIGDHHLQTALATLDVIMTFTPVVSGAYDVTQLVTGKTITGEQLSDADRALIFATIMLPVVVGPGVRYLKKSLDVIRERRPLAQDLLRIINKFDLMPQLEKFGLSDPKTIRENAHVIRGVPGNATDVRVVSTSALNAANAARTPNYVKSYNDGKIAIEYTSGAAESFARVFNDSAKMPGRWVGRMEDFSGRTGAQIKHDFALENVPKYIAKANVPGSTPMRISEVGINEWGGAQGKLQFEIVRDEVPRQWFEMIGGLQ